MVTLTLDDELAARLRVAGMREGFGILKQLADMLPQQPARCPHSEQRCGTFDSEYAIVRHLIDVHSYPYDEYGEDTAQTNAYRAWRTR